MAKEFKVVFEGEVSERFAAQVNAAIQSAVLNLVASNFPDPEGTDVPLRNPGGPIEESIRLRGIYFLPNMAAREITE
jgi:hypothetical protein